MDNNDYEHEVPTGCYCSTCNNPPCGYCEGRGECDECGKRIKCDDVNEMKDGSFICSECYEELRDKESE